MHDFIPIEHKSRGRRRRRADTIKQSWPYGLDLCLGICFVMERICWRKRSFLQEMGKPSLAMVGGSKLAIGGGNGSMGVSTMAI